MPLQLTYTAQSDVPDALKSAYVEKDGKYVLDVELPDTTKLDATIKATRTERDTFKKAAEKAEGERDEAARKLEAMETEGGPKNPKVTELLAKWEKDKNDAVAQAVTNVRNELAPMVDKVTKYELDDVLVKAFETAGGRSEKRESMLALAKAGGWALVDGKAVKKDSAGTITNVSLDDYFTKDFKKSELEFYKGSQASGGGAGGITKPGEGGGKMSLDDFRKMSPAEQLTWSRQNEATS